MNNYVSIFLFTYPLFIFINTYPGKDKQKVNNENQLTQIKTVLRKSNYTWQETSFYLECTHPKFKGFYADNSSLSPLAFPEDLTQEDVDSLKKDIAGNFKFILTPFGGNLAIVATALAQEIKKKKYHQLIWRIDIATQAEEIMPLSYPYIVIYAAHGANSAQKLKNYLKKFTQQKKLKDTSCKYQSTPCYTQKINHLLCITQGSGSERDLAESLNSSEFPNNYECWTSKFKYFTNDGVYYNPDFTGIENPFVTDKKEKD